MAKIKKGEKLAKKPFNDYKIFGDTTLIYLTQNQIAIIDTEDLQKITQYRWQVNWSKNVNSFYASTTNNYKYLSMHRLIMSPLPHLYVDHINHYTLNNSKSNLRITTNRINCMNNQRRKSTAKYRHVYKKRDKFRVQICINKKPISFGIYETEIEAATVANQIMKSLNYPDSCLNKIEKVVS